MPQIARAGLRHESRGIAAGLAQGVAVAVERGTPLAQVLHAQAADVQEAGRRELIEVAACAGAWRVVFKKRRLASMSADRMPINIAALTRAGSTFAQPEGHP